MLSPSPPPWAPTDSPPELLSGTPLSPHIPPGLRCRPPPATSRPGKGTFPAAVPSALPVPPWGSEFAEFFPFLGFFGLFLLFCYFFNVCLLAGLVPAGLGGMGMMLQEVTWVWALLEGPGFTSQLGTR